MILNNAFCGSAATDPIGAGQPWRARLLAGILLVVSSGAAEVCLAADADSAAPTASANSEQALPESNSTLGQSIAEQPQVADKDVEPSEIDPDSKAEAEAEAEESPALRMQQEAEILKQFEDEEMASRCINLRRLDRSDVLSNQTIVFRMKGDKNYLNRLRYRCPGLGPHDTIMYETQSQRLCNLDSITVLNDFGGRFLRGARCGLGMFFLVDDETVELLKGSRSERRRGRRGKGTIE